MASLAAIGRALSLIGFAALPVAAALTSSASTAGCTLSGCTFDYHRFNITDLPSWHLLENGTAWESNGIDDKWIRYPGQQGYGFIIPFAPGLKPREILVYLSTEEDANAAQFALASGNLAETNMTFEPADLDGRGAWNVFVHNDTCGDYFMRLYVRTGTEGGGDSSSDAGPALDGGESIDEAGPDGSLDDRADAPPESGSATDVGASVIDAPPG